MKKDIIFKSICKELQLGNMMGNPLILTGGFMHKMYQIKTDQNIYAIKMLNPVIMKRKNVFDNYKIAETLERKLEEANIPIAPALEFQGKKMQCVNNQYFYVFHFLNGNALKPEQIKKLHCEMVSKILAKIHKIDSNYDTYNKTTKNISWDYYIELAHEKCPEIEPLLLNNKKLLVHSQQKGNDAIKRIPSIVCICHGDMDNKNVLWENEHPKIIDLECLHYGNPYVELFELALCWCGYEQCNINYGLLKNFITSYIQEYGKFEADWTDLYYNNNGRLEWLEYNLKRALMIECGNEEEKLLGINQVKETMKHVIYYNKIKNELIKKLTEFFP